MAAAMAEQRGVLRPGVRPRDVARRRRAPPLRRLACRRRRRRRCRGRERRGSSSANCSAGSRRHSVARWDYARGRALSGPSLSSVWHPFREREPSWRNASRACTSGWRSIGLVVARASIVEYAPAHPGAARRVLEARGLQAGLGQHGQVRAGRRRTLPQRSLLRPELWRHRNARVLRRRRARMRSERRMCPGAASARSAAFTCRAAEGRR